VRDTDPDTERRLAEAWLECSPGERLRRVFDLNELVDRMLDAGLRWRSESVLSPEDLRRRRAALRLDRETLIRVTGWDPASADQ
jgi:hypothetical protein